MISDEISDESSNINDNVISSRAMKASRKNKPCYERSTISTIEILEITEYKF